MSFSIQFSLWMVCLTLGLLEHISGAEASTCPAVLDTANATGTGLVWDTFLGTSSGNYVNSSHEDVGVLIEEPLNATAYGLGRNISYSVAVRNGTQHASDTLQYPALEHSVWVGTPPSINFYDGNNDFSGCAILLGLPSNTQRLAQEDDGSCEQTLSQGCINQMTRKAGSFAYYQVAHPLVVGAYNNITKADGTPLLSQICYNIAADLGSCGTGGSNPIPSECQPYLCDETSRIRATGIALTSNSTPTENCSLQTSDLLPNYTLRNLLTSYDNWTGDHDKDTALYDTSTRSATAILTVLFPTANISHSGSISPYSAFMTCVRPTRFAEGSRVSPLLPAGVQPTSSMSKGKKIGIGVGVGVGVLVLIIAGVSTWLFLRRKRRARQQSQVVENEKDEKPELLQKDRSELPGGGATHEMKGSQTQAKEAGGLDVKEVPGSRLDWELEGQAHHAGNQPQELE